MVCLACLAGCAGEIGQPELVQVSVPSTSARAATSPATTASDHPVTAVRTVDGKSAAPLSATTAPVAITGFNAAPSTHTVLTLFRDGNFSGAVESRWNADRRRFELRVPGLKIKDGLLHSELMPDLIKGIKVDDNPADSRVVFQLKRRMPMDVEVSSNRLRLKVDF